MQTIPITKSIKRRMEEAVVSLFPVKTLPVTIENVTSTKTIAMHIRYDETTPRDIIYADVEVRDIRKIFPEPDAHIYSLTIQLSAVSQMDIDKDCLLCDALTKDLQDFFSANLTKSALSTATGFTVDGLFFQDISSWSDEEDNIQVITLTAMIQNAV